MTNVSLLSLSTAVIQIPKPIIDHFADSFCTFETFRQLSLKVKPLLEHENKIGPCTVVCKSFVEQLFVNWIFKEALQLSRRCSSFRKGRKRFALTYVKIFDGSKAPSHSDHVQRFFRKINPCLKLTKDEFVVRMETLVASARGHC